MEVTIVTRTISGCNYDNISAIAILKKGDTIESVAMELDNQLKIALTKIQEKTIKEFQESSKKDEDNDLPF